MARPRPSSIIDRWEHRLPRSDIATVPECKGLGG